jgi:hypothetical protein
MSAAGKRKGAQFETDLLKHFRTEVGLPTERLRLAGAKDEGDLAIQDVGLVYLVEAKAEARMTLSSYVKEARLEAQHYAFARGIDPETVFPLAIVKRAGLPISESYVVTTIADFFHY